MKIHQKYKSISENPEFVKVTYTIHIHNIYSKTFDATRFLAEILVGYFTRRNGVKKLFQRAYNKTLHQYTSIRSIHIPKA